jgi:hypothetical protein
MDGPAGFERIGNQRNDDHCDQDQFDHKVFHERPPSTCSILRASDLLESPILQHSSAKGQMGITPGWE